MPLITLTVKGAHCKSCGILISDELKDMGAKKISVKVDEKSQIAKVSCETDLSKKKIADAIKELGDYKVV